MTVHVGVLVGVTLEAKLLRRAGISGTILLSGARRDQAENQVRRLVAAGATHLLSFGFAGGLDPDLRSGQVILPRSVTELDGTTTHVAADWHQAALALSSRSNPVVAPCLGVDDAVTEISEKRRLFETTHAVAVDMESHIVAKAGLPFLILRAVCDEADAVLPKAAIISTRADGSTDMLKLIRSVLRRPGQIGDLIRLGRSANAAKPAYSAAAITVSLLGLACASSAILSWT